MDLLIKNTTFQNNTAWEHDIDFDSPSDGEGGAIYYACNADDDFYYNCDVQLQNNTFQGNKAGRKGGSLRYINKNFTMLSLSGTKRRKLQDVPFEDSNVYMENQAPYGADLASFPAYIEYIIPENDAGMEIDTEKRTL